jgi:8-oxo-dGTP pyrophosphatase MutT (NUDIX family)
LILFYEKHNLVHTVLIKRPVYEGVHSGQVAFPGGKWEVADKSLYHTAIRESAEEIGILPEKVEFIGKLTDLYIPPSNYIVSPFVGIYNHIPTFSPDPNEVSAVIEIPLNELLRLTDPFQLVEFILPGGISLQSPGFDYQGNIVWGATAMILNEFLILWKTTVNNR